MIVDNSIVSRQDVLNRPSVNQMTFPISIIIRQKIYIFMNYWQIFATVKFFHLIIECLSVVKFK